MILVCGEALMDVFTQEATSSGMVLDARVGGSPVNVAIGLARLGVQAAFFGGISQGVLGQRLVSALTAESVDIRYIARSHAPTTLSLIELNDQGVPSYAFYGEGGADRSLSVEALDILHGATPDALHFGSYTMVVEPVASVQRQLVERYQAQALISYDPNIRLNVQPDLQPWLAALQFMVPRVGLLKISLEDFALLLPDVTLETQVQEWLNKGVALVVVTRGSDGVSAWSAAHRVDVQAYPCQLVDTVGAGDSFQAAMLAWLEEHNSLSRASVTALAFDKIRQMLMFAARAAALTCSRQGADLPSLADLK